MAVLVDDKLPGGNIALVGVEDHEIRLCKEMRGTKGRWFYWKFRAVFDRPGEYRFRFMDGDSIGPRGAAYSVDNGKNWSWTLDKFDYGTESFWYTAKASGEVWFCVCVPYMESDLREFLGKVGGRVAVDELCRTREGRSVELLTLGQGRKAVFLSSRHHCQESMATYSMEGLLQEVLDHPETYRDYTFYAVPFVDKDGVEDGDQGKNRIPHDHARDYGPRAIHPEVMACMALIERVKPALIFDMHCPWLRSSTNEYAYFVGQENKRIQAGIDKFSAVLQKEAPAEFPFRSSDDLPFGQSWNTGGNYEQGKTAVMWAAGLPWQPAAQSIEIPFANQHEVTIDALAARKFGAALARTIAQVI